MSWWTKFKVSLTGSSFWNLLGPAILDLAKMLPKELILAGMEWVKQADTQDGWTGQEKRIYVISRLKVMQSGTVGNPATDAAFDMLISAIVVQLQKGVLDSRPMQPIPPPETDPYYRPLTFDPTKIVGLLHAGDKVFYNHLKNTWYVQKNGLGLVPVPAGFDFLLTVQ